MEQRICGKLMGVELALCPSRFSFPWLCAGPSPEQRGSRMHPQLRAVPQNIMARECREPEFVALGPWAHSRWQRDKAEENEVAALLPRG